MKFSIYNISLLFTILVDCSYFEVSEGKRPSEQERVALWHKNGNTWPPKWQDESPKRQAFLDARDRDLQTLPGSLERWENYMQYTQSRMVPHFTEKGFTFNLYYYILVKNRTQ